MSRFDRFLGLARSMAIYHGIAGRQRRMRKLYAALVVPGDLVFDIGAHAGNRTRAFAALGCDVVALEPQPDFARVLQTLFARTPRVTVVERRNVKLGSSQDGGLRVVAEGLKPDEFMMIQGPWDLVGKMVTPEKVLLEVLAGPGAGILVHHREACGLVRQVRLVDPVVDRLSEVDHSE